MHSEQRWEIETASRFTLDDLDTNEIAVTVGEAIRRGRLEDPGTRDSAALLQGRGVLRDGKLLRAAAVLFGRSERLATEFPHCLLNVARFRRVDRTEFLDNRQFHGSVFDLQRRAERFVIESMPIAGRIEPGPFTRIDEPLYPTGAVREALANAFCHRDYVWGTGAVSVRNYDDRLEVTSSGTLHFGLTPRNLFEPHDSQPWNPLLASVMYRRGIIEQWGRGTLKMSELTQAAGLPRPEIEVIAGAVVVRFRPSQYVAPARVARDIAPLQQAILTLLASAPAGLAFRELSEQLGAEVRGWTLNEQLRLLRQLEMVEPRGYGRGARWFLLGQQNEGENS